MKSYVLTIWNFIDPIYYKFTRLTYIHKGTCDDNILRVRLTRYKGKNITLSDGTQINKNDTLIKIHLHNVRLLNEMKSFENNIKKRKVHLSICQKVLTRSCIIYSKSS
ncbi:YkoP family protein [Bacillus cytotoxicus]